MDRERILAAIRVALASGIHAVDETTDPEKGHTFGANIRSLTTVTAPSMEPVKELMSILEDQPELRWMMGANYRGVGILPLKVANWLLAKSLQRDPEHALRSLVEFAKTNKVDGLRVAAIYGAYIEESATVDENTRLLPLWELQPSLGLDHLAEVLDSIVHHLPLARTVTGGPVLPAVCALVRRFEMFPALRRNGEALPKWQTESTRAFGELEETAYALALLPNAIPQIVSRWIETDGIDAIPGLTGGAIDGVDLIEIVPRKVERLHPVSASSAAARISAFCRLPRNTRQALRVPLRRLAMAGARRQTGDRAIELGIALEALFGDLNAPSEMTHKIAARGAIYVSKDVSERRRNFFLLKTAYKIRSKVVHGGQLKENAIYKVDECPMEASQVIRETMCLARAGANRFVELGGAPDWTKIDLGIVE